MAGEMPPDRDPNAYTVKDILTQFVMPALEDLRKQQALQNHANEERFSNLEAAKNKGFGALILITAVLLPISIPVISAMVR